MSILASLCLSRRFQQVVSLCLLFAALEMGASLVSCHPEPVPMGAVRVAHLHPGR
jgi:hypothetical protein